jgi:hypothetical protein
LALAPAFFYASAALADPCPKPVLDGQFNLSIPCVGVNGVQYQAVLGYTPTASGIPGWRLNSAAPSVCEWDAQACATIGEQLQLLIPGIPLNGTETTAQLAFSSAPGGALAWTYAGHAPTQTRRGKIDSHGTLLPYAVKQTHDGTGKKLLAIYMVGSNLESGSSQAGTTDLLELVGGYRQLAEYNVDVIAAFGGSSKDNWQGMKFADMAQLLEDANDARFGNLPAYLYRADHAHMGDASSFKLFLNYLGDAYVNYDSRFLVMWDHGASYLGFGNDETYNMEALALPEIQEALADSGQHFNLLGFDACLMASLETAKYTHNYADYLLASEEVEPGHGWNWTEVVKAYSANSDIRMAAKAMIDNYVEHTSHSYSSSGKTLSLADLSRFPAVEAALAQVLTLLNTSLATDNGTTAGILERILQQVRAYSNSHRISLDVTDFLIYLQSLSADPAVKEKVQPLLDALQAYLVYARNDGSRPYSYGATLDRLDNAPYKVNLNEAISEVQRTWQSMAAEDRSPPETIASNDRVEVSALYNVTAEELAKLRAYIDSGALSASALPWWEKAYLIMADTASTLDDKLTHIAALENESGGVFSGNLIRGYYLNKGVEIGRVEITRGVEIIKGVEITDTDRVEVLRHGARSPDTIEKRSEVDFIARPVAMGNPSESAARAGARDELLVQRERAAFSAVADNSGLSLLPRTATSLKLAGSIGNFTDDNPIKVTAVYGTIYYNSHTGEAQDFDTFAELEAFPTQTPGTYFTYAWNRMWYTLKYSPEQSSLWLPLRFNGRVSQNQVIYTSYTGEILYRDWQSRYPELGEGVDAQAVCGASGLLHRKGKCFQQAILELYMDEANRVQAQFVRPYQVIDDQPQFDKDSQRLKAGDEVWFMFDSFGLEPGATPIRLANTMSKPVLFEQDPQFDVEMMAAVSASTLLPKKFYYAMRVTDISGKTTISPPFLAKTPMPACAKLRETESGFTQVLAELAATPQIVFVSPLGNTLDQAASTVMVAAEAEEDQGFLADVEALYRSLYNTATLDLEISDWVWGDRVNWASAKSGMETVLPKLTPIVQRECAGG